MKTMIPAIFFSLATTVSLAQGQSSLPQQAADAKPLLQKPTLSKDQVAFAFAGDLWIVERTGGEARRLTRVPAWRPTLSSLPTVPNRLHRRVRGQPRRLRRPRRGGVPRRLTYHPGPDQAVGWTPDGKRCSLPVDASSYARFSRLFTLAVDGAASPRLPLPMAVEGSYSPDGTHLAYVPFCNYDWPNPRFSRLEAIPRRQRRPLDRGPCRLGGREAAARQIPTTSTPCGSATGSTSSPTATGRRRSFLRSEVEESEAGHRQQRA